MPTDQIGTDMKITDLGDNCIQHFHLERYQGSYRQDCVKFKDFSRTFKRLSYCFKD